MRGSHRQNLKYKVFGDRRDQRSALREAGFADEASAVAWADDVLRDATDGQDSKVAIIARLRRARPDLTLATATYIAHQRDLRSAP